MGGADVTAGHQVSTRMAGHPAQANVVCGGEVSGQQVGHQLRPSVPGSGLGRATGITDGQNRLGVFAGGGSLSGSEPVAQHGLGEPVHLQPSLVNPGQRLPGQLTASR
jgi:hypothetical protein